MWSKIRSVAVACPVTVLSREMRGIMIDHPGARVEKGGLLWCVLGWVPPEEKVLRRRLSGNVAPSL